MRNLDFSNISYTLNNKGTNFTFKAHRDKDIYAVNSIVFNPAFGTFVTAGSDGKLYTWDKDAKVKLKSFPDSRTLSSNKNYPTTAVIPIVETAFNTQGTMLAAAFGYDWSKGVSDYEELTNEIQVHICTKDEVEKKPATARK